MLQEREMRDAIRKTLDALPSNYRTVLTLKYVEGLSYRAIAEEMSGTEGSIKMMLYRARAQFLDLWKGGYGNKEDL